MSTLDLSEIAGAKATHRYARLSASKVRVVLDLIRNEDVKTAADILRFTDRGAAEVVAKVLNSAIANATHNEGLVEDELYVAECYADEGPTLKRWRPRARGRATRINKRTCHITVIVARLDDEELDARESRGSQSGGGADRSARVAASRRSDGMEDDDVVDDDGVVEDSLVEDSAVEDDAVDESSSDDGTATDGVSDEVSDSATSDSATSDSATSDSAGSAEGVAPDQPYGPGSAAPQDDDSAPEGFEIKGNADSMKYHEPGGRWYDSTVAEVWFNTAEAAIAAGFLKAGTRAVADTEAAEDNTEGEA